MASSATIDAVMKLPPDVLAKLPSIRPPPGVTPNFIDPPTVAPTILAICTVLLVVMLSFVAVRFYVVCRITRRMAADDWMAAAAVVGIIYYYILMCLMMSVGFGIRGWNVPLATFIGDKSVLYMFLVLGPTPFIYPFPRAVFLLMYLKIFEPLVWLRRCAIFGLVVVFTYYWTTAIILLVWTAPTPGQPWSHSVTKLAGGKSGTFTLATPCFGLFIDIYTWILPMIAVSRLNMTPRRKSGVIFMFSTGAVCWIATSMNIWVSYNLHDRNNPQLDTTYRLIWVNMAYMIEMCVGISTSCMPSVMKLCKHHGIGLSTFGISRPSQKTTGASYRTKLPTIGSEPVKRPWRNLTETSKYGSQSLEMLASGPSETALVKKDSAEPNRVRDVERDMEMQYTNVHMDNFEYRGRL